MTPFIQPKLIHSPISGEPVRPRLETRRQGEYMVTEAIYIDPASGEFIRKGVVSMTKIEDNK